MHGTLKSPFRLATPHIQTEKSWQKATLRYMDEQENETGVPSPFAQTEKFLGGVAVIALKKEYPGHRWRAIVDVKGGYLAVRLDSFSNWGDLVHIRNKTIPEIERAVVRAGGLWLEKYGFPRRGLDVDDYRKNMAIWLPTYTRNLKPPD